MQNFLRLLVILLAGMPFLQAQQAFEPCGTDYFYREAVAKNPEILQHEAAYNQQIRESVQSVVMNKRGKVLYVPVVFHIIHQSGTENISQAQIMDQIRIINEDFRKKAGTNGDSQDPLAADLEIEFRLAQYDPNGNKHDGINRISSSQTNDATNAVKGLSYWDAKKYLNIWVVKTINNSGGSGGTILGYAQFPWMLPSSPNTDGIVIRADQVGTVGIGSLSQQGRTLTHEIGHWLGLYHTFQGGCVGGSSTNCASQGDLVCDTPPVESASFGCNTSRNSCTNDVPNKIDMVKNYMDYSDGNCLDTYTAGQKTRVTAQLSNRLQIFGSSPSYTQNIAYSGLNADGTYITVPASTKKAPYTYGFEEVNPVVSGYRINNFNNPTNGWAMNTNAYAGNGCIAMRNFLNPTSLVNARDGFQTPEINISTVAQPYFEFMYAYAQRSTSSNDSLVVRISNNFGMNETVIWGKQGTELTTAGVQTGEYIPAKQDWRKVSIDLTPYKSYTNARFRFEFVNRRGNNAYVDNIAITNGPTATSEAYKSEIGFSVFPNPVMGVSEITFQLNETTEMEITLMDVLGNQVTVLESTSLERGSHRFQINKKDLSRGIYFVRVHAGSQAFSHKILIN